MTTIAENVRKILAEISPVKLVCVTKGRSVSEIEEAIRAGVTKIGENLLQEAQQKFQHLALPIEKHFLGRIQKNKIKKIVALFDVVQSVESIEIAEKLNKAAAEQGKTLPVFIQVNIDEDQQKSGARVKDVSTIIEKIKNLPNLKLQGLMTIGKLTKNPKEARATFQKMKKLFQGITPPLHDLSMGMSNDYTIAIKEGATMVRVGRAIFP